MNALALILSFGLFGGNAIAAENTQAFVQCSTEEHVRTNLAIIEPLDPEKDDIPMRVVGQECNQGTGSPIYVVMVENTPITAPTLPELQRLMNGFLQLARAHLDEGVVNFIVHRVQVSLRKSLPKQAGDTK